MWPRRDYEPPMVVWCRNVHDNSFVKHTTGSLSGGRRDLTNFERYSSPLPNRHPHRSRPPAAGVS